MRFTLESEQETDGRWIAEVVELPGVLAYGATKPDAVNCALSLALRVLAEKLEHGELKTRQKSPKFELPVARA
jgi:predicted RNase H-like HicB family nuclease